MKHESLILQPIVTEKAVGREEQGIYIFKVINSANKPEIAKAIEKIFGTKVKKVRIINTSDEMKQRGGRRLGMIYGFKKAVVTLEKGQNIKIREEKKTENKKGLSAQAGKEGHTHDASHTHADETKLKGHASGIQKEKSRRKTVSA